LRTRPSTIFSTIASGLPLSSACALKISRSLSSGRGRHLLGAEAHRVAGSDVHGDVATECLVAADQLDHHADAHAVTVAVKLTLGTVEALQTTHLDVLADLGDQSLACGIDGAAVGQRLTGQRLGVLGAAAERGRGYGFGEGQEVGVLGDEVGLAVDLDHDAGFTVVGDPDHDHAFGGGTAGLLGRLRLTGLAHGLDGGLDVSVGFHERGLALHHAGAGALAQFLDQCG
jgi:hypothetical protein